jgi:hypothetical protein
MPTNAFVIDRSLGAVSTARMLEARTKLRVDGVFAGVGVVATVADRAVLSGSQTLQPDELYPAEKNSSVRYYLPRYAVARDEQGRPDVRLRFAPGESGEIGRLVVTLSWTAPVASGVELRVIDHTVIPTLRYRVPVQQADGSAQGGWEKTMALQPLQPSGHLTSTSTTVFSDKSAFDAVYQALRAPAQNATLDLSLRARVGMRTWKQILVGSYVVADQKTMLKKRGALYTTMLQTESFSTVNVAPMTGVRRVRMVAPVAPVAAPVAPPPAAPAAPVSPAIRMAHISPAAMRVATPMRAEAFRVSPAMAARPAVRVAPARPITDAMAATAISPAALHVAATRPITREQLAAVNRPQLKAAVAVSDLKIQGQAAVPINVILDENKQPAVVDAELDNKQSLPFTFDPLQPGNRDVFVDGGYTGAIHLLVPRTLVGPDGSMQAVVYQDSLMRDVLHVQPSGFRLERESSSPFLPSLSFLASDFSTADNDDEADVLYRVVVTYRLEPWLDPNLVELGKAELAKENLVARFTTSVAHDAKLTLDLDLLAEGQVRAEATVDPRTGIVDTLDLDHQAFVRLWRERLAGPGVGGVVEYKMFDGSPARVPVRLALNEPSADIFSVQFIGPVEGQPGRYRVSVRNQVESPARIKALPPEVVSGGVAHAVNPETVINQLLQPQEARQIDYVVSGSTEPLAEFSPAAIGYIEPNLPALLKLLMLTSGYSSLGFKVAVRAVAGAFAQPAAGQEPLTGLLVEFDDGARATLTAADPDAEVAVVGRLTDQILGTADQTQRFFYRVTNMHPSGEGARTSWLDGQGSGLIEVAGAVGTLDF